MDDQPSQTIHRQWPVALAAAIGIATVAIGSCAHSMLTGAPLNLADEWAVLLFQVLVVATPFLILALLGVRARTPWLVGIALTAAFWGFVLYVGVTSYGDGSGANIGLGLLMLLSPVVISGASLVAGRRELVK